MCFFAFVPRARVRACIKSLLKREIRRDGDYGIEPRAAFGREELR